MAISTVIGTMAAIYLTRSRFRGIVALRGLFDAPIVLPGMVIGLALYVFHVSPLIDLARTFGGMMIGHVMVTCPFVIATVSASLFGFDRSLEEAGGVSAPVRCGRFAGDAEDHFAGGSVRARSSPSSSPPGSSTCRSFSVRRT